MDGPDPQNCRKYLKKKRREGDRDDAKARVSYLIGILNARESYTNLRISSFVIGVADDGDHV